MATQHDDLEAVKNLIDTLSPFEKKEQERILRWACEKLGITQAIQIAPDQLSEYTQGQTLSQPTILSKPTVSGDQTNIKTFVATKNPASAMQFAATVAYYLAFEAPEALRKEVITSTDLQDACRKVDRERLHDPGKTLHNAHSHGLLDKGTDRGTYKINTVGENLVAVTLPSESTSVPPKKKRSRKKSKAKKVKKKVSRKRTSKK